jgi:actin-related protein
MFLPRILNSNLNEQQEEQHEQTTEGANNGTEEELAEEFTERTDIEEHAEVSEKQSPTKPVRVRMSNIFFRFMLIVHHNNFIVLCKNMTI